jgi:SAM-dependent methyltransferase
MGKDDEIAYAERIGEAGRIHAAQKPFSDNERGRWLQLIGAVLDLLPPPPARVLDMGCGTGWTTEFLHRSGYEAVGVDIAADMIELGRSVQERQDITFVVADYESMADLQGFDAVLFFDSLHHADDERAALAAAYRALVPGGRVVCSEPGVGHAENPGSLQSMAEFGVTEKDMPPRHIIEVATSVGFARGEAIPYAFDLAEMLAGIDPNRSADAPVANRAKHLAKQAVAWAVVRAFGGRSPNFDSDLDELAYHRVVSAMMNDFVASGRGGFTILHKAA